MTALLDICARLPRQVWYEAEALAHDQRGWPQVLAALPAGALLSFDLGSTNFAQFAALTAARVTWLTRAKSNLAYTTVRAPRRTAAVHEALVWIGAGADRQQVRLIEVLDRGTWARYLTNELAPARLPAAYAVALYWQRGRIEDAYTAVKRLLGLAYFWAGSANGVQPQLWATWILYMAKALLLDGLWAASAPLLPPPRPKGD